MENERDRRNFKVAVSCNTFGGAGSASDKFCRTAEAFGARPTSAGLFSLCVAYYRVARECGDVAYEACCDTVRDGIAVKVVSDGVSGFAECADTVNRVNGGIDEGVDGSSVGYLGGDSRGGFLEGTVEITDNGRVFESGNCGQWTSSIAECDAGDHVKLDVVGSCVPSGGSLPVEKKTVRGPNWERNVLKRKLRKERKIRRKENQFEEKGNGVSVGRGFFSECSSEVRKSLRESRAELLVEQNKLALLKAKRGLKVLEDSDVNEEVRRYRTSVRATTEKNMVSIEKTHATLKSTGNVPGFAETVVSDGGVSTPGLTTSGLTADGAVSCSITPDSSASQAEFRACQKALLDSEKQNLELKEALKKLGVTVNMSKNLDKETFTDDTVGNDLFAEFYPQGEVVHYVDRNGKQKFKVGEEYVVHDFKKMKETMGDKAWNEFLRT